MDLLHEFQDLYPTKFFEMKGIVGEMKIPLRSDAKLVKQRPWRLNPCYKEKVKVKLDGMLVACVIELVEESEWINPIVLQEKKTYGDVRICVDLKKLNDVCLHDPFSIPFTVEVLENVGEQEMYSFIDGFLGYHKIRITKEYQYKTTLATERGYIHSNALWTKKCSFNLF